MRLFNDIIKGAGSAAAFMSIMIWIDVCDLNSITLFSLPGIILLFNFFLFIGVPATVLLGILYILLIKTIWRKKYSENQRTATEKMSGIIILLFFVGMTGILFRTYGIYFEDYPVELHYWGAMIIHYIRWLLCLSAGFFIYFVYVKAYSFISKALVNAGSSIILQRSIPALFLFIYIGIIYMVMIFFYGVMYGGAPIQRLKKFISANVVEDNPVPGITAKSIPLKSKIIFLGIDGLGWNMIDRFMKDGQMPAFQNLMEKGCYGYLKTYKPTSSPLIWNTMATGLSPEQHGIVGYIEFIFPGMGRSVFLPLARGFNRYFDAFSQYTGIIASMPVRSSARKAKALWEIIDEYNGSTATFNWWPSYPTDEISGIMVSDSAARKLRDPSVDLNSLKKLDIDNIRPVEFAHEIFNNNVLADIPIKIVSPEERVTKRPVDISTSLKYLSTDGRVAMGLGLYTVKQKQNDFTAVYIHDADNHIHWEYMEPQYYSNVDMSDPRAKIIPSKYMSFDRIVEEYLQAMDDSTILVIASDHSIRAVLKEGDKLKTGSHINMPPGVVIFFGKGIKKGFNLTGANVYDIAPTILACMGLPVSKEMPGRVMEEMFTNEFKDQNPITMVDSYGLRNKKKQKSTAKPVIDEKFKNRLRTLGYIE